ncbi:MAG: amidohydrolase [Cyclobacteriaceae bacterium]|nr:amidohydrolase [Cyclobacteriaceae bacterium]MCB0499659.1 amidohydrolase [Cyclobacteriaceae bacterium]MCB9239416.1 amidohydrolase [Flammeovirgaceae bacterium]MCO5271201.1 amidohydrolase [Cyclobacteriaceae bacterium]MCW5902593.1 amidohydrolase [Cyclobacteriaceae bacterium]
MRTSITLLVLVVSSAFVMGPPVIDRKTIKEDMPFLLEFYKTRHKSPEVSLQEKETSKALAAELRKAGFTVTENFGRYGIVGVYKNGNGPTILYRTDMDGLPINEKTGLPYQSQLKAMLNGEEVGTMHACGHDIHMTTWLGTARAMVSMKDKWRGTLLLIGQPAEEIGEGAKLMLNAGLYEKFGVPTYGIGLHSSPTLPAGKVGIGKGYVMASSQSVDINVYGVGSHGASPQKSIDPLVVSSMLVMELQTIVSRNLDPIESAVVTVGAIKGGTVHNIIPDKVTLKLTIRTFKAEVLEMVNKRIKEIAKGMGIAAGLPEDKLPEVVIKGAGPANYNNPAMAARVVESAVSVIGKENVIDEEPPVMLSEDFSYYGQTVHKVPTVFYWLGTVPDARMKSGDLPGLHSPYYYPQPEISIETGVGVTSQALLDLFNTKI